jgi:hypothetical protein
MTSPSPITSSPSSAPDNGGGGDQPDFSPSRLTGKGVDPDQTQQPDMKSVTERVRDIEQGVLSLAKEFPAVAPEVRRAVEGVRNVLKRILAQPGAQEPQAPRSLG